MSEHTSAPHTISVVGAVFTRMNGDGVREVLAFRRGPGRDGAGLWEFAGGKIEPGETPEQALAREVHEELGIHVVVGELLIATQVWVEIREVFVNLSCFFVTPLAELPTSSTDHDEMRWVPVHDLHTLKWIAPDVPAVEALQRTSQRCSAR